MKSEIAPGALADSELAAWAAEHQPEPGWFDVIEARGQARMPTLARGRTC